MPATGFDSGTILKALHTKWAGNTVHFAQETDSTNLWIKRLADGGAPHGTLAVTEFQSAGRGRFERSWRAPAGTSVMMSLLLRPEFPPASASMLTLVMGLSVAQAVKGLGFSPEIKWPNDVVLSGRKICGILTEMRLRGAQIDYVVIGAGINVNLSELPPELSDKATSLYLEGGRILDRSQVLARVLERFEDNYGRFARTLDFSGLQDAYEGYLANRGRMVRVLEKEGAYEGVCRGINQKGELLVQKEEGTTVCVSAGEVSVRGLYSYI